MEEMAPEDEAFDNAGKAILDLEQLASLLSKGLSRSKPWQRELADLLASVMLRMQILRMTIAMEKANEEVNSAATGVVTACREAEFAMAATRADATTRVALKLLVELANAVQGSMKRLH